MKNEYLTEHYQEVSASEFYRDIFPAGSFEREGHPEDEKGNGILTIIEGDKAKNRLVFDDLKEIKRNKKAEFAIMSPISYAGRNRTAKNARWLHAIAIDLDGVEYQNLRDVFYQAKNGLIPQPTYTVNSGHGLHLYYLLDEPIPLYRHLQDKLREFKYSLIESVWNPYTSTYTERNQVQYQGIYQGFRVVGTQSKLGKRYPVRAFKTGKKTTIEHLNKFLYDKSKAVTNLTYQTKLSLDEAKEKFPEWYQERIEDNRPKGRWHVKRDLYDWWINRVIAAGAVGHRYFCICVLAAYAVKCDIPEDELLRDGLRIMPILDARSDREDNRFTKRDVLDAIKMYQESYVNFSRAEAERISGISMPANKRNGRKQAEHLLRARAVQAVDYPNGEWRNKDGRPNKQEMVQRWRAGHPTGKKIDCERETGLSRPTILKWWNTTNEGR